jgi:cellulose synthase/poly-beta-1,6-N-acetylglucosamine synthase-like glycosyltransferase
LVVPCRDEAAVIERKVANLARVRWPEGGGHRLVVVDDGSDDGTLDRARAALEEHLAGDVSLRSSALASDDLPGKAGALRTGLRALEGEIDVLVLTDADVVLAEGALCALAEAFDRDPRIGMASGAQRFAQGDGSAAGTAAAGRYDRWTDRVRALESRSGRLFSVHGQLLAWRAELGLLPPTGVAADDLELMLAARASGARVVRVPEAVFVEEKTPRGPMRDAQRLRRARAYVQVVRRHARPLRGDPIGEVQWALYRTLPLAAPRLVLALALALPLALWVLVGPVAALVGLVGLAALGLVPAVRDLVRLLAVIDAAARAERRGSTGDRWEMART